MEKNYFYLFSLFLFSILAFPLIGMNESSGSDVSFLILNARENFEEFYQKYFNSIFDYGELKIIVKRFSFIFWYLKERNIGDILNFQNTFVDFKEKNLTPQEINGIKKFFKDTVTLIAKNNIFNEYLKKKSEDNVSEDPLLIQFTRVFKDIGLSEEYLDGRNTNIADLTFLVKGVTYTSEYIQEHVASDVHSSPEYFGLEYEPIDFSTWNFEGGCLEEIYTKIQAGMKEKDVSFFCGDLADRDSLGFLDADVKREKGQPNADCKNFFLYNFFKDYYHTVHAAWQFYCLKENQSNKVKRWQVSGNHETAHIHKYTDYKNSYGYFSGLISSVRQVILPTEIYFFQSNGTIVLRHGFFTQKMNEKNHVGERVNENFKFIYLIKEPTPVYEQFSHFIKGLTNHLNPVYWSDHHDTNRLLDLDILVEGKNDLEKSDIPMSGSKDKGYRGYYNTYSWARGIEIGKETSGENFKLINKEDQFEGKFLNDDELSTIEKSHWALFCGHSHNTYSLEFSAVKNDQENTLSFHPYYVRDETFLFHFSMCAHHNLYLQLFNQAFENIKKNEPNLKGINWKRTQSVHALETYSGAQWIKEKMKGSENSLETLTKNSVIREFFSLKLEKKAKEREDDTEEKIWLPVKVLVNTQQTQIEHPQNNEKKNQTELIKNKLSLVNAAVALPINAGPEKTEAAIQTEENDNKEQKTQTNKVMNLSVLTVLENKFRSTPRASFDEKKKPYLKNKKKRIDTDIDSLRIIGTGFLGSAGLSLVRQVTSQGIKNFSKSIYDSWQQKGKFRLVLKRKDIFLGGGGAMIGYALYCKFPLFFNQKKENKEKNSRMKEN